MIARFLIVIAALFTIACGGVNAHSPGAPAALSGAIGSGPATPTDGPDPFEASAPVDVSPGGPGLDGVDTIEGGCPVVDGFGEPGAY